MTTDKEVIQMALDALEQTLPTIEDFGAKEQLQFQHKAIAALYEALRAALAAKEPELEPVAWYDKHGMITHDPFEGVTPLYTAPPQREWQGLTDEERDEMCLGDEAIARAIEAKLKEKNT